MAGEVQRTAERPVHQQVVSSSVLANNNRQSDPVNDSSNKASAGEISSKQNELSITASYWRGRLEATPALVLSATAATIGAAAESGAATCGNADPAVNQAVNRVIAESGRDGGNTGATLAEELARGNQAFQAQVMGELASCSPAATAIALSAAGGNASHNPALNDSERQMITQALSSAAAQATLPSDFAGQLVTAARNQNMYGDNGAEFYRGIATAIGTTGSEQLASDYARSVMDYVNNPPSPLDPGAAVPAEQEALIASAGVAIQNNAEAVGNTFDYLGQNSLLGEPSGRAAAARFVTAMASVPNQNGDSVLGDFLAGTGAARAPLSAARELFEIVSNNEIERDFYWQGDDSFKTSLMEAPGARDGLSHLFLARSSELLASYTSFDQLDDAGKDYLGARTLGNFFRQTTLNEIAPLRDEIVAAATNHLDSLRTQVETGIAPDGGQLTVAEREALARQNGRILSSVVVAYNQAINDYADSDASNDQRDKNATAVAAMIASGVASLAFAPLAAPIYVTAGIQGGKAALDHFLTRGTIGEQELKQFEELIGNSFEMVSVGGNLNIQGVTLDEANTIKSELNDGINEMISAWVFGERVLQR